MTKGKHFHSIPVCPVLDPWVQKLHQLPESEIWHLVCLYVVPHIPQAWSATSKDVGITKGKKQPQILSLAWMTYLSDLED